MASDLFPVRRAGATPSKIPLHGSDLPLGNALADAVARAFRETFGLADGNPAGRTDAAADQTTNGIIVPHAGETNP